MITKERKISKSFWALTLVLVMFLTNIFGTIEVFAAEKSAGYTLDPYSVVSEVITGKINGDGPFDGVTVTVRSGKFTVSAVVNPKTGEFEFETKKLRPRIGTELNITVKEPDKDRNTIPTIVPMAKPEKVGVKDPRKLTEEDKDKIRKAIRDANTTKSGVAKLPESTAIDFDEKGNITVGTKPESKITAEEILKNLKPDAPEVKLSDDEKNITITPNLEVDTDAKKVAVTYTDKKGTEQTITATKDESGKWTVVGDGATVDQNGVVTLPIKNAKAESTVTATVTDAGGIAEDDKEALTSEKASLKLPAPSEYIVSFDGNGGSGAMESKNVKKGDEYTLPENGFTAPEGKEFAGWKVGNETTLKQTGEKITVTEDVTLVAQWKDKPENPEKPGTEEPGKPGTEEPGKPETGDQDPSKPGRENPNEKPENGGRVQPWPGYWWYFGNNTDPIQASEVKTQEKQEEIEYNNHERYMYGYPDGTVRPEGMMTRAEAAALIARLAKLDMSNDTKPNFKDTESAWYNSAINAMTSKDLMFADKDGNFRPNQAITRAEFARALYGVDKKNDKVAPFEDVKGHEFEAAINQAYGNGRINGYPDGTFKPDAYIQRSEAARILNQYANRGVDFDGLAGVRIYLIKFTDIDESHWAYYEIMEAANSHEYKRARGKQIETWLQILNK